MQAVVGKEHNIMYYKRTNLIGIRAKAAPKPQVMSFGGKHCHQDEKGLRALADRVLQKLNDGESVAEAKAWVDSELACEARIDCKDATPCL
jgi:hypothetical protein